MLHAMPITSSSISPTKNKTFAQDQIYETSHYTTFTTFLFISQIYKYSLNPTVLWQLQCLVNSLLHPKYLLLHKTDLVAIATLLWSTWGNKKRLHSVQKKDRLINIVPRLLNYLVLLTWCNNNEIGGMNDRENGRKFLQQSYSMSITDSFLFPAINMPIIYHGFFSLREFAIQKYSMSSTEHVSTLSQTQQFLCYAKQC